MKTYRNQHWRNIRVQTLSVNKFNSGKHQVKQWFVPVFLLRCAAPTASQSYRTVLPSEQIDEPTRTEREISSSCWGMFKFNRQGWRPWNIPGKSMKHPWKIPSKILEHSINKSLKKCTFLVQTFSEPTHWDRRMASPGSGEQVARVGSFATSAGRQRKWRTEVRKKAQKYEDTGRIYENIIWIYEIYEIHEIYWFIDFIDFVDLLIYSHSISFIFISFLALQIVT